MSEPWAMALHTDAISGSAPSSSSTTERRVSDMLVPVSPSGTGYTLRLFTASRWSTSAVTKDGDDLAECSGIEDVQRHGFGSYKADVAGGTLTGVRFAACRV